MRSESADVKKGGMPEREDAFTLRVRGRRPFLSSAVHRVAKYIEQHRAVAVTSSARDLAAAIGTSDATVVRAAQSLGFDGLGELKRTLAATLGRRSTPADDMQRTLGDVGEGAGQAIDLVFEAHREAIDALRSAAARERLTMAVSILNAAERIVVFGIGPSAPLARYVGILLARTGRFARTLDATGIALADQLLDLRAGDALVILAYGRSYREVVAVFAEARRLGLRTVLVTDTLERRLCRQADVVIPARRGRKDRVALHGATFVVLEAIVLGLAACERARALETLERLNYLREIAGGMRADVG